MTQSEVNHCGCVIASILVRTQHISSKTYELLHGQINYTQPTSEKED